MLQLNNIVQSFPGCFQPILRSLSLRLDPGEFCVMIGSNGSGKSTLLRAIAGESVIDSGTIMIDGHDVTYQDRSAHVASVVQDVNQGTIPEMTLLENMVLSAARGCRPQLTLYSRLARDIGHQIKTLGIGLEHALHRPLRFLSGGQRQMIATLMAIHSRPSILLLDEHTSALAPPMQAHLMSYTAQAVQQNAMTCVMVTHKLDDAIRYGHRLILLHQGTIVFEASGVMKSALHVSDLLERFHHYEDLTLTSEERAGGA